MTAADHSRITTLAADRAIHRAFAWLHLHEPQIRRWQIEAVSIPAPPFQESVRAAWFRDKFAALSLHNPHIDAEGNALAELPAAPKFASTPAALKGTGFSPSVLHPHHAGASAPEGAPTTPVILLSAHLDTVFPPNTDCTPAEDGPILRGPGACDNGAGLAALLAIAAALRHAAITPSCTILFAANVGEEGEGDLRGMRHLLTAGPYAERIRSAIALEGSGDATVIDRALGSRRLRVTVTGPGGHSWADAGRPNPILALSAGLLAISRLPLPANPRTTLNVGAIHGGTSINSIPASVTADLDLRSTSAHQLDLTELSVLRALDAAIAASNDAPRADATPLHLHIERIGNRLAGALSAKSPLSRCLRSVDRHLNIATESRIGSTDANLPLSLNIPALAIGAGGTGGGIHTLSEWHDPTGRSLALRRILLLLLDTCNTNPAAGN
jgi:tripeptide aminopeptidase